MEIARIRDLAGNEVGLCHQERANEPKLQHNNALRWAGICIKLGRIRSVSISSLVSNLNTLGFA